MSHQYYSLAEIKRLIERHQTSYYVYLLARPGGQPFYVGCARIRRESRERIQDHDWLARTRDNSWKSKVIRWIWKSGGEVQYRVVGWFNTEAAMFACERSEIRRLGRRDLGLGPLVNGNDGGTGQLNPSVEIRAEFRSRIIAAAITLGVNRQDLPANRAPMHVWVEMASKFGVSR